MLRPWRVLVIAFVLGATPAPARVQSGDGATTKSDRQKGQTTLSPEELRAQTTRDTSTPLAPVPQVDRARSRNWPLHNLDLANSRFATLDQINSSNITSLAVRWLYHTRNSTSTPIVVDGMMYLTTSESVVALDAATGRPVWINTTAGSNRGAAYGDGKIYVAKDARVMALDARTGKPIESFGDKGVSHALTEVLKAKYPHLGKPAEWGYYFNMGSSPK